MVWDSSDKGMEMKGKGNRKGKTSEACFIKRPTF